MGIKLGVCCDVLACSRKVLKGECLFVDNLLVSEFKSSAMEMENVDKEIVSIENRKSSRPMNEC
jgi:hypothetical protein